LTAKGLLMEDAEKTVKELEIRWKLDAEKQR
jgi:hypothetical protein